MISGPKTHNTKNRSNDNKCWKHLWLLDMDIS